MELTPSPEEPTIPRWLQITAGIVLLPLTLLKPCRRTQHFWDPQGAG